MPAINKPQLSLLQKRQKMSLTQTYYLAHTARRKLSKEAARADHDLRLLVGHANLLDGLMLDLADAEREQESWFNETVRAASVNKEKHISWADELPAVSEDDESDADSDASEEDEDMAVYTATTATAVIGSAIDLDDDEEEDDEDDESLQLRRTPSRSSPPELMHESDSEEEDESMPPSPPPPQMELDLPPQSIAKKQQPQLPLASEEAFYEQGFYLPQRQAIAAY